MGEVRTVRSTVRANCVRKFSSVVELLGLRDAGSYKVDFRAGKTQSI
jgi:hypothetical protein